MKFFRYRINKHFGLFFLIYSLLFIRLFPFIRDPQFVFEDSFIFFAGAYNSSWFQSIFEPYAGYFHLLPRALAEILSVLPIVYQPLFYILIALFINSFLFCIFYHPVFRRIIRNDGNRFFLSLLFTLSQNAENLGLILGLHWYLAFAWVIVMLSDFHKYKVFLFFSYVLVFFTAWSSPSVFVSFPFLLYFYIKTDERQRKLWYLFATINLVIPLLFTMLMRVDDASRAATFTSFELLLCLDRMILRGLLGCGTLGTLIGKILAEIWLLSAYSLLFLSFLIFLIRQVHKQSKSVNVEIILLLVSLMMIVMSFFRSMYITEMANDILPRHIRYLTCPSLFLMIVCGSLLVKLSRTNNLQWFYIWYFTQSLLLISGMRECRHFGTNPTRYHLRDYIGNIEQFEREYNSDPKPQSLYLPHDLPNCGPTLEKEGGVIILAEEGLVHAVKADNIGRDLYQSWLGKFQTGEAANLILHEIWGNVEFLGVDVGRVFFKIPDGRLMFTSELLFPDAYIVNGEKFILLIKE